MTIMEGVGLRLELNRLMDEEQALLNRIVDLAKRADAIGDKFTVTRAIAMFEKLTGGKDLAQGA